MNIKYVGTIDTKFESQMKQLYFIGTILDNKMNT